MEEILHDLIPVIIGVSVGSIAGFIYAFIQNKISNKLHDKLDVLCCIMNCVRDNSEMLPVGKGVVYYDWDLPNPINSIKIHIHKYVSSEQSTKTVSFKINYRSSKEYIVNKVFDSLIAIQVPPSTVGSLFYFLEDNKRYLDINKINNYEKIQSMATMKELVE